MRIDSADQIDASVLWVCFEEPNEFFALSRRPWPVLEPQPPQQYDRLPVVVKIARVLAHLHLIAEELPIIDHYRCICIATHRKIEHHRPDSSLAMASPANAGKHPIDMARAIWAARFPNESADEHAIDSILTHPFAME